MDDFIPVNAPLLNGNERKYQENLKGVEDLIQLPLQRTEYADNIY